MKIFIALTLTATLGVAHATDITIDSCRGNCSPADKAVGRNVNRTTMDTRINLENAQRQAQGQKQSISGSGNSSNTSNVDVGGNNATQAVNTTIHNSRERNVASAFAASIPPTAVCSGSTSGGAQGAGFGFSVGSSWTDQNCMLLEQVRTVAVVLSDEVTAAEMLCAVDAYREARIRTGRPCVQAPAALSPPVKEDEYTDPIIRARLGLPPLKG